ncbi:hypothetical protein ZIOFF_071319 [Zingiber officinale]|uniref:Uncharacterized protein n=1 Tax=Zingiber officinale TaxID=94328 RepID=A0A8J5C145_ZINOF|nr:hypothetical protein ZIOFF_071319 [Zingiber officinale]
MTVLILDVSFRVPTEMPCLAVTELKSVNAGISEVVSQVLFIFNRYLFQCKVKTHLKKLRRQVADSEITIYSAGSKSDFRNGHNCRIIPKLKSVAAEYLLADF